MARWITLGLTLLGFALVFSTKSPGLLGLGLLLSLVGIVGFVFALAAARVSASARPEASMVIGEDVAALRRRKAATAQGDAPAAASNPSGNGGSPRQD